jgi:hypothetical protein
MRLSQVFEVLIEKNLSNINSIIQKMRDKHMIFIKSYQGELYVLPKNTKKKGKKWCKL